GSSIWQAKTAYRFERRRVYADVVARRTLHSVRHVVARGRSYLSGLRRWKLQTGAIDASSRLLCESCLLARFIEDCLWIRSDNGSIVRRPKDSRSGRVIRFNDGAQ